MRKSIYESFYDRIKNIYAKKEIRNNPICST